MYTVSFQTSTNQFFARIASTGKLRYFGTEQEATEYATRLMKVSTEIKSYCIEND